MSKKPLQREITEESRKLMADNSADHKNRENEASVLYLSKCPGCGEDLKLFEDGVFIQGDILGITEYGEIGCKHSELDGYYLLRIWCPNCGHEVCSYSSDKSKCEEEFLLQWAKKSGVARPALVFDCPVCNSPELWQHEINIEISHEVVAVCEPDAAGEPPLIALNAFREIDGGSSFRYRCSNGHELAKDDGSPVETSEELVAWLKARSVSKMS